MELISNIQTNQNPTQRDGQTIDALF